VTPDAQTDANGLVVDKLIGLVMVIGVVDCGLLEDNGGGIL